MRRFLSSVLEVVEVALVALGAVFLIRVFLVQPFLVSGSSMVPNFLNGDYLLIDELTYRLRPPLRGEVAVFHDPQNESIFFIKRIIGVPGDQVKIMNGHVIIVNDRYPTGRLINESYLPLGTATDGRVDLRLGPDDYFALGDNRPYSFDSRRWGVLKGKEIVGLVRIRLWPLRAIQTFAAPPNL